MSVFLIGTFDIHFKTSDFEKKNFWVILEVGFSTTDLKFRLKFCGFWFLHIWRRSYICFLCVSLVSSWHTYVSVSW